MSETTIIAIIAAVPPTLASIAALLVSVMNATRVNQKQDTLLEKATEIHTLTNGNLTKVSTELEVANTKIEGLHALLATQIAATTPTKNKPPTAKKP